MKKIKTNAMRKLEKEKIPYIFHTYMIREKITVEQLSLDIGVEPHFIFKTLVTESPDQNHYVFCLPLEEELDLKKAARAADVKSLKLIDQKDLLSLTGYERGGVSPIGMKKNIPTFIDEKALDLESIVVSAGKKGFQLQLKIQDIEKMTKGTFVDLLMETRSIF